MSIGRQDFPKLVDSSTSNLSAYRDAKPLFEALKRISPGQHSLAEVANWCAELDLIDSPTDKFSPCGLSTS